jgi:hypothetical protein
MVYGELPRCLSTSNSRMDVDGHCCETLEGDVDNQDAPVTRCTRLSLYVVLSALYRQLVWPAVT